MRVLSRLVGGTMLLALPLVKCSGPKGGGFIFASCTAVLEQNQDKREWRGDLFQ